MITQKGVRKSKFFDRLFIEPEIGVAANHELLLQVSRSVGAISQSRIVEAGSCLCACLCVARRQVSARRQVRQAGNYNQLQSVRLLRFPFGVLRVSAHRNDVFSTFYEYIKINIDSLIKSEYYIVN